MRKVWKAIKGTLAVITVVAGFIVFAVVLIPFTLYNSVAALIRKSRK